MALAVRPRAAAIAAGLLAAACTETVDSWEGSYGLTIENRDNGCQIAWPSEPTFMGFVVTELDHELLGLFRNDLVVEVGSDLLHSNESLRGLVDSGELHLFGQARPYMIADCTYVYYPKLRATRTGEVVEGTIRYSLTTDQATCTVMACTNEQRFSGERARD